MRQVTSYIAVLLIGLMSANILLAANMHGAMLATTMQSVVLSDESGLAETMANCHSEQQEDSSVSESNCCDNSCRCVIAVSMLSTDFHVNRPMNWLVINDHHQVFSLKIAHRNHLFRPPIY
ncbi:MAG: hypothetical protein KAG18_04070 [Sinobacterium sp.]|nr:hypothetical protein [Sinobacterium sp.]